MTKQARAMEKRILSEADRKASEIETEAERIVSEYYKEFSQYPDLRIFLDKLRTLAEALKTRTTLIITDEESPWDLFDDETRMAVPQRVLQPGLEASSDEGKPSTAEGTD